MSIGFGRSTIIAIGVSHLLLNPQNSHCVVDAFDLHVIVACVLIVVRACITRKDVSPDKRSPDRP